MLAADRIMVAIQERHARRFGPDAFARFTSVFVDVTEHQRDGTDH